MFGSVRSHMGTEAYKDIIFNKIILFFLLKKYISIIIFKDSMIRLNKLGGLEI